MSKRIAKNGATDGAATKKACTGTAGDSQTKPAQVEEEQANNVFSHELDTLQCDICFVPFESEVYSCKNGHAACGNCCVKLDRKCPSCNESIGDIRCRAMEKILAGMTRLCKYKKLGCKHILRFTEIRAHEEETCRYAPYPCPFDGCTNTVTRLRDHMVEYNHGPFFELDMFGGSVLTLEKSTPFCVLLHRDGESVFLLLNGRDVPRGRSLSVVRLYPRPDEDGAGARAQNYAMIVKGDRSAGTLSLNGLLSLNCAAVQFVRRTEGKYSLHNREFLFVPDACWGSSDTVTVDVTVHP